MTHGHPGLLNAPAARLQARMSPGGVSVFVPRGQLDGSHPGSRRHATAPALQVALAAAADESDRRAPLGIESDARPRGNAVIPPRARLRCFQCADAGPAVLRAPRMQRWVLLPRRVALATIGPQAQGWLSVLAPSRVAVVASRQARLRVSVGRRWWRVPVLSHWTAPWVRAPLPTAPVAAASSNTSQSRRR